MINNQITPTHNQNLIFNDKTPKMFLLELGLGMYFWRRGWEWALIGPSTLDNTVKLKGIIYSSRKNGEWDRILSRWFTTVKVSIKEYVDKQQQFLCFDEKK